jgi:hypothetical protein
MCSHEHTKKWGLTIDAQYLMLLRTVSCFLAATTYFITFPGTTPVTYRSCQNIVEKLNYQKNRLDLNSQDVHTYQQLINHRLTKHE